MEDTTLLCRVIKLKHVEKVAGLVIFNLNSILSVLTKKFGIYVVWKDLDRNWLYFEHKTKKMFWYELARYIFTYSYPINCLSALCFIVYLLILVPLSLETLDQLFCVLKKEKKVNHFLISAVHTVFKFVIIWFRNLNLNFCSHFYVYTWKTVAYLPMVITMVLYINI